MFGTKGQVYYFTVPMGSEENVERIFSEFPKWKFTKLESYTTNRALYIATTKKRRIHFDPVVKMIKRSFDIDCYWQRFEEV